MTRRFQNSGIAKIGLTKNHPSKLAIAFVGDVDESVALRPLSLWQKVQFCQLSSQSPNI